jgi:hypothetical protein
MYRILPEKEKLIVDQGEDKCNLLANVIKLN